MSALEKVLLQAVLCFPLRRIADRDELLLARKTKHIGQGLLNGYGGGIEGNELPEDAMVRELEEECALKARRDDLQKIAVVDFHNTKQDGETFRCRVHVYLLRTWEGTLMPTEEMVDPRWYPIDALPFDEMMLADREWVPAALTRGPIYARAHYGPRQHTLLAPVEILDLPEELPL